MSTDVIAAYASAHKGNPLASPEKQIIEAGNFSRPSFRDCTRAKPLEHSLRPVHHKLIGIPVIHVLIVQTWPAFVGLCPLHSLIYDPGVAVSSP